MAQDTLLGFPAHTLPYRRGAFTTLSIVSRGTVSKRPLFYMLSDRMFGDSMKFTVRYMGISSGIRRKKNCNFQ